MRPRVRGPKTSTDTTTVNRARATKTETPAVPRRWKSNPKKRLTNAVEGPWLITRRCVSATVQMIFLTSRETLNGANCFTFEEFGVGGEAEGFEQVSVHVVCQSVDLVDTQA